jgi:hypothetical protein
MPVQLLGRAVGNGESPYSLILRLSIPPTTKALISDNADVAAVLNGFIE